MTRGQMGLIELRSFTIMMPILTLNQFFAENGQAYCTCVSDTRVLVRLVPMLAPITIGIAILTSKTKKIKDCLIIQLANNKT